MLKDDSTDEYIRSRGWKFLNEVVIIYGRLPWCLFGMPLEDKGMLRKNNISPPHHPIIQVH